MVGQCNGYTVTGLRHSRYTESNIYLSCTRVERGFLYMLVTCSIGCTSHQSLILYIVAINIYNIMRSNRGTGDPLQTTLISDRGLQFTSKVFEEICKIFGIDHRKSTVFHLQTDGESECLNQELETYLRLYCADHTTQWKDHLPFAEFAHNIRIHQSTKMSPFEIMFGT